MEENSVQNNTPSQEPEVRSLRDFAVFLARLLFGGTAFVMFLGLFAAGSSLAEITTHFRAVYACAAVVSCVIALLVRHRALAVLSGALLCWVGAGIVPWYLPAHITPIEGGRPFKVVTANVDVRNADHQRFVKLLEREAPDVVFVQETTPAWFEALADAYPYRVQVPHPTYFGLGLYSRYPIENVEADDPVDRNVPILRAEIDVDGRRIHVINVHIPAPEGSALIEIRVAQFAWLEEYLAGLDRPAIVAGDFNCTMWSPLYEELVERARLLSGRQGRGILPTWFPLGGSLSLLPLDQILGRDVAFSDFRLGDSTGSDHRPLIAEVLLPPAAD